MPRVAERGLSLPPNYVQYYTNPSAGVRPGQTRATVQRAMTLDTTTPLLYGCCPPLFDWCLGDEDIGRLFWVDNEPFLNWLGIRRAESCLIKRAFLQYVAPAGASEGTPQNGLPTSICLPGAGAEYGFCDFTLDGFGTVMESGPIRKNGGADIPYCVTQPRYTIDGQRIMSQTQWDYHLLLNVLMQHLAIRLLIGNKTTSFDADGLLRLIKTGYLNSDGEACPLMDSTIVDWNSQPGCGPDGANGITVTGSNPSGALNGMNLFDVLRQILARNMTRMRMAGMGEPTPGDIVIAIPDHARLSLIECAVCWLECSGDYTRMDSAAARDMRRELMNGGIGWGYIDFDGFPVPFIPFNPWDWTNNRGFLDNADGTADFMMLWRGNNSRRVLTLEYNDLSDGTLETTDDGQFQTWTNDENRCIQENMATEWRVYSDAPWAQVLVTDFAYNHLFGPVKPGNLNLALTTCE